MTFFPILSSIGVNAQCHNCCQPASNAVDTAAAPVGEVLGALRKQIDSLDSTLIEILAKRMQVCLAVGEYKKAHGVAVVQTGRYREIVAKRSRQGADKGLDCGFVGKLMDLIHDESVRQQEALNSEAAAR